MTSSPAPTPRATRATWSAVVQLDTAHACGAPTSAANSRSNAATSGPCVTHPERMARAAAATSASSSAGRAIGIIGSVPSPAHPVSNVLALEELRRRAALRRVPVAQATQAVLERDSRREPEQCRRLRRVRAQVVDVAGARLDMLDRHGPLEHLADQARQRFYGHGPAAAEVDRLADDSVRKSGRQNARSGIGHVR